MKRAKKKERMLMKKKRDGVDGLVDKMRSNHERKEKWIE